MNRARRFAEEISASLNTLHALRDTTNEAPINAELERIEALLSAMESSNIRTNLPDSRLVQAERAKLLAGRNPQAIVDKVLAAFGSLKQE
jgi:hypothetical protein